MKRLLFSVAVIFLLLGFSGHARAQNPCDARIVDGKLYIPCLFLPDGTRIEVNLTVNENLIAGASDVGPSTAPPAPVPRTGQTDCWDVGASIDCAGTGQDGERQGGVAWPNPRFTDNGDGTVTDNLTGLIWLRNANCFGYIPWLDALNACNSLGDGGCGLSDGSSAGDWRLPASKELESLRHFGFSRPTLGNTAGTGQWREGDPFTGFQSSIYWSSTTYPETPSHAWYMNFNIGHMGNYAKTNMYYVWPVRGGQ